MAAFIFDLGMTLVDSSALDMRASRTWAHSPINLQLIKPFAVGTSPPHELPALIKKQGHKVAIVTSSPHQYAEALIKHFNIETDVLVALEDTKQHKPYPEPIFKALKELNIASNKACYIGDERFDVEASYHAGIFSIGAGWGVRNFEALSSTAPNILLLDPSLLLRLDELRRRGYFAEMMCRGISPEAHQGAILPCGNSPFHRYALGRYFNKTRDSRHTSSTLSRNILDMKEDDRHAQVFARALVAFVHEIKWTPDYIVPVPPKPGQSRNYFEAVLNTVGPLLPDNIKVALDGLRRVRGCEGYKLIRHSEQRINAVWEAFKSTRKWDGLRILLLDDVLTTGATTDECARVLQASEASEVRIVTFGKAQRTFEPK